MKTSELILNPDGSVYHLHLRPEQIAETIITVGDPDRVSQVSRHFERIDERVSKREFVTHTGELNGRRLTVISTGIGTDNIDIVFNELDALVNIDLDTRINKEQLSSLTFVRIGTSGSLRPELPLDSFLASSGAIGLEGLLHSYQREPGADETLLLDSLFATLLTKNENESPFAIPPYYAAADPTLLELFAPESSERVARGITLTASGFYAPQGRELRLRSRLSQGMMDRLVAWTAPRGERISNLEMETAGIYGLAHLLGHRAISLNALLANRQAGTFSKKPGKTVDKLIEFTLDKLTG